MVYFVLAIIGLLCYSIFMISKFSLGIRITKFIAFLHFFVAFLAMSSFLLLLINKFLFKLISLLGLSIMIVGFILIIVAAYQLKVQVFMPKGTLIKNGVYSYTRNPIYLGLIIISIGSILSSFSIYLIIYTILLVVLYLFIIKAEEKELSKRFGLEYEIYKKKVASLIPRLK